MKLVYLEGDHCSLKYLLGAFRAARVEVHQPDRPPDDWGRYDAALLSDFPAHKLGDAPARALVDAVRHGLGLVMVGGWTSFGRGGYARSPIAAALPVALTDGDDRVALPRGAYPRKLADHEALADLAWDRAPVLCGYNRMRAKRGAETILSLDDAPLLVAGELDQGRVLAYASDLAPHWSGGLTDWGDETVPGPEGEEVGTDYVELLARMLRWTARMPPEQRVARA